MPSQRQPAKRTTATKSAAKTKPAATVKKAAGPPASFAETFQKLRAILTPYATGMTVVKDDAQWYYLDTKYIGPNKKPIGFAGVRLGKGYVSFYLMCAYCNPKMLAAMSPALKKRMQGKSCFNFKESDEALFAELARLTKIGADWFATIDWANHKWTK